MKKILMLPTQCLRETSTNLQIYSRPCMWAVVFVLIFSPLSVFASTPPDSEITPHDAIPWYAHVSYFEVYEIEPPAHLASLAAQTVEEENWPSDTPVSYHIVRYITTIQEIDDAETLKKFQEQLTVACALNPERCSLTTIYDNNGNLTSDGTWTHTWNWRNEVTQSQKTGSTVTYTYDHTGQRVKLVNGSSTTRYANKLYSWNGTKNVKHVYLPAIASAAAGAGQLIATLENATLQYIHTDHLTGSNAATDITAAMIQLLDYYPYGVMRIDWQGGTFDEQRKFTGHELDRATNLTYANARYYKHTVGRFLSQDQVFLAVGNDALLKQQTGLALGRYLSDPQGLNSYSYARNNPLRIVDPGGTWFKEVATGQQSWSSFVQEVGEVGNYAYANSTAWQTALDHPVGTGLTVGVGGGLAASGISAGITYGLTQLGVIGGTAGAQTNKVIDYAQRYGQNLGNKMNQVAQNLKGTQYDFSDHAIMRIAQRVGIGNESRLINILNEAKSFEYFHEGVQKLGYFDAASKTFISQIKDTGTITTIITEVSQNYVNNLMK